MQRVRRALVYREILVPLEQPAQRERLVQTVRFPVLLGCVYPIHCFLVQWDLLEQPVQQAQRVLLERVFRGPLEMTVPRDLADSTALLDQREPREPLVLLERVFKVLPETAAETRRLKM